MTGRILIYYKYTPHQDRWFKGDRHIRKYIRRIVRGQQKVGGIDLVFLNLCAGLDQLGVDYVVNLPFNEIRPEDHVGIIGRGAECLAGYQSDNMILAGVAVAQHPMDWPTLFDDYPVGRYVVHSDWVRSMYERVWGPRIDTWAVGIDTDKWAPAPSAEKRFDVLVYDKVRWDTQRVHQALLQPIIEILKQEKLNYRIIRYGHYSPNDLQQALAEAKSMIFMCEHETQGLAYQQALSSGVPVLAWDPGRWLDPWRYHWGEDAVLASSVPFFDQRCGRVFRSLVDFRPNLEAFLGERTTYAPREYVLENLTLAACSRHYIELLTTLKQRVQSNTFEHKVGTEGQ
jgi:hypothetical protein